MLIPLRTLSVGAMMAFSGSAAFAQIPGDDTPINPVDGERLAAIAQAHIAELEAGNLAPDQRSNSDAKATASKLIADRTKGHATLSNDISSPRVPGSAGTVKLESAVKQYLEMAKKISATSE